jgi:hypothetical protein
VVGNHTNGQCIPLLRRERMSFNWSVYERSISAAVWYEFRATKHWFIYLTRNQRHRQRQLFVVPPHVDEATVAAGTEAEVSSKST